MAWPVHLSSDLKLQISKSVLYNITSAAKIALLLFILFHSRSLGSYSVLKGPKVHCHSEQTFLDSKDHRRYYFNIRNNHSPYDINRH